MRQGTFITVAAILLATALSLNGQSSVKGRFVGNYKLIKFESLDEKGASRPGAYDAGRIMYDAAGQMAAQLMRTSRAKTNPSTDTERVAAYQSYFAYYGGYTVDESKGTVVHHLQGSTNPSSTGTRFRPLLQVLRGWEVPDLVGEERQGAGHRRAHLGAILGTVSQPNPRAWWVLLAVTLAVVVAWPPHEGNSLAVKIVNWAADPTGQLPVLPPQLGMGLGDDPQVVELRDAQVRRYDDLFNQGGLMRRRLELKVATDPFNPVTERQLLLVVGVLVWFAAWRLGGVR